LSGPIWRKLHRRLRGGGARTDDPGKQTVILKGERGIKPTDADPKIVVVVSAVAAAADDVSVWPSICLLTSVLLADDEDPQTKHA
jgi:hypothetical protein